VPTGRKSGASHVIRAFDHLLDSARAYAKNLNTHRAYRELREKRAQMRATGKRLDGYELAGTLTRYSQRGQDYVRTLRSIIRANELQAFDGARLGDTDLSAMLPPST
jgi:Bax protein